MNEVAGELGCDWHTVNDTVVSYGEALLDADDDRIGMVTALGLDEVLMVRLGPYHRQHFSTQMVNVRAGQLLDVVPGRGSAEPMAWLANQGPAFRSRIEFGTLDLSGPYRRVFEIMVPGATLVADPFHVCKLANTKLDECRRRVQNETLDIGDGSPIRSTGAGGCSPGRRSALTTRGTRSSWACSGPATRTVTLPPAGKRKRQSESCTPTPMRPSPSSG